MDDLSLFSWVNKSTLHLRMVSADTWIDQRVVGSRPFGVPGWPHAGRSPASSRAVRTGGDKSVDCWSPGWLPRCPVRWRFQDASDRTARWSTRRANCRRRLSGRVRSTDRSAASQLVRNYVDAMVQRDMRDLSRIRALDLLPLLPSLAASQSARLLNISELASPFQVSRPTIKGMCRTTRMNIPAGVAPASESARDAL